MNKSGALMEWYWQEKVELLGIKPIPGNKNVFRGEKLATNRSSHMAGSLFHCVFWFSGTFEWRGGAECVVCIRTLFRPIAAACYCTNSIWRLCVSPKRRNKQIQKRPLEQQWSWEPRTWDTLVSRISNMAQNLIAFPGLTNDYKNYSHLFLCN